MFESTKVNDSREVLSCQLSSIAPSICTMEMLGSNITIMCSITNQKVEDYLIRSDLTRRYEELTDAYVKGKESKKSI